VVGSVFPLMQEYAPVWQRRNGSSPAELFGFRFDVGLDPIEVNVERMVKAFRHGCEELGEIWEMALDKPTLSAVRGLAANGRAFHLSNDLWADVVLEFAWAYRAHPLARGVLLRSLTPLYLARVASFVRETESLVAAEVEEKIEQLCLTFENLKPGLIARWTGRPVQEAESPARGAAPAPRINQPKLEVTND
jgi:glucosylglycerate synthase